VVPYINVSVEATNYRPLAYPELLAKIAAAKE
jgi:calcineurin-like phosphoesterase family protein